MSTRRTDADIADTPPQEHPVNQPTTPPTEEREIDDQLRAGVEALLTALARLYHRPGGLAGLRLGLPFAIKVAVADEFFELAAVYQRLHDLAGIVQADLDRDRQAGKVFRRA